jgi:hypothetical protein
MSFYLRSRVPRHRNGIGCQKGIKGNDVFGRRTKAKSPDPSPTPQASLRRDLRPQNRRAEWLATGSARFTLLRTIVENVRFSKRIGHSGLRVLALAVKNADGSNGHGLEGMVFCVLTGLLCINRRACHFIIKVGRFAHTPCLSILHFGNQRLAVIFPTRSSSQSLSIC